MPLRVSKACARLGWVTTPRLSLLLFGLLFLSACETDSATVEKETEWPKRRESVARHHISTIVLVPQLKWRVYH